jgi:hypothetical protein
MLAEPALGELMKTGRLSPGRAERTVRSKAALEIFRALLNAVDRG